MATSTLRFDHFALPVFDVERTYHFYADVLELPLVEALSGDDWGGKPWLMMIFGTASSQEIALCALRGAERPPADGLPDDIRHFAFSVDSAAEQERWKGRLHAHGVEFSEEDHGVRHSIYFRDPNGIVLEVTTPASEAAAVSNDAARGLIQRWIARGA
jgi:catechol 2,3-dioxygenase-like lactoylglutathione lyase family enzyme